MPDYEAEIEAWHSGDDPRPLHEYLGLTWEQYAEWISVAPAAPRIEEARELEGGA